MKVDSKGRVSLPAELRAELPAEDGRLMLFRPAETPWINGCVYREFDDILAEMEGALPGGPRTGAQRLTANILGIGDDDDVGDTYAESVMVQLDKEGRFVLPSLVTQALEIKEMITFVGRRSVFQMWHPAAYEAHRDRNRVRRLERYASNAGGNA